MKNSLYLLLLLFSSICLGQIKVIKSDTHETIGRIAPLGKLHIECTKSENTITFTYSDIKFTTIDSYDSFSFEDIDNAFDSLYEVIIDGFKKKKKNLITIELPEGEGVIFLNFVKNFGVMSVQIAHAPYKDHDILKYSVYLTKNKAKKLFGKI